MTSCPRRVFSALIAVAIVVLSAAISQSSNPLHPITASAASTWLDRLNAWRAATALPALTENTTWDTGDYDHSVYMVKNDLVTHYETTGTPYYTTDGDTAARNGNIFVSSTTSTTDDQAIDWWMQAPFHALGMMDPRLTSTGFGSYREVKSGWDMGAALDVLRGNSFTGGQYPVYFPGNGSTEPLTAYGGGESPDPLQACSGYAAPTGLPVFIQVGGNVATTAGPVSSFTGNGVALEHCVIDSNNSAVGSSLTSRGAVILIPKAPLQSGVQYTVALTVNGVPYTWSFTVGSTLTAFNPNACTSLTATTTPPSTAAAGTQVTIAGTAAGCPNPRYRFWALPPGGSWQMLQDYSTASSYVWTAPPTPGVYHLEVDARDQTSVTSYDAASTILYTVTGCTSAFLTPSVASPQPPSTTVTFTAASTGCTTPEYKFFLQAPGASWIAQTAYGAGTWAWNTAGVAPGTYGVGVWVHSVGSATAYEAYWIGTYTVGLGACRAATVSTASVSPQTAGTPLTFTATGCAGAQFRFWLLPPGGSWTMVQDYGAGTWNWSTSGYAPGTYEIGVWARQPNSTASYEAYGFTTFVLGSSVCTASLAPSVATPQAPGATVTLSAGSTGCSTPLYQFWLLPPGGTWTVKQPYAASTTWSWNTSGYPLGTYQVGVWAKASSSSSSYDAYYIGTYQLDVGPCTAASISASPASPQVAGTSVTFTAGSVGCTSAQFEFWVLPPGGTWTVVQPYAAGTAFLWNSTSASGPYRVGVWARQAGSPSRYDAYAISTFWVGT